MAKMALLEELVAEPPPLRADADGTVRVGETRVSLDTVIGAFKNGAAPEAILLKYPSLRLPDIYAAIAYHYWNVAEVEQYLQRRVAEAAELRRELEAQFPPEGIRERLLARRSTAG
jgi:uncharacterized protein (DUF433 family)